MKKILSFIILLALLLSNLFIWINNNVSAAWLDNTWHLIDKTSDNNFKILKWTPFKFSFYNKLYNYFRLTDDGALVFGISPDNNNLEEWNYVDDKNNSIIKIKPWVSTIVKFTKDKTKIVLPSGINYININWQYKISDGSTPVDVRKGNEIELADGDVLLSNSWLTWLEVEDESAIEEMHDNVKYDDAWTSSYVMITPWFINLDLRDPNNKWYGIIYRSIK